MRKLLIALAVLLCSVGPAFGYVSIGIHLNAYPALVPVPGYPVMYAPGVRANYFFYDGRYWIYVDGTWYSSPWYDGPWDLVVADYVPYYLLSVPVRYYMWAPPYFRYWPRNAPPRWDQHWGNAWAQRHHWANPVTLAHGTAPALPPHPSWTHPQPSLARASMPNNGWAGRPADAQPLHSFTPRLPPAMNMPHAVASAPAMHSVPAFGGRGRQSPQERERR